MPSSGKLNLTPEMSFHAYPEGKLDFIQNYVFVKSSPHSYIFSSYMNHRSRTLSSVSILRYVWSYVFQWVNRGGGRNVNDFETGRLRHLVKSALSIGTDRVRFFFLSFLDGEIKIQILLLGWTVRRKCALFLAAPLRPSLLKYDQWGSHVVGLPSGWLPLSVPFSGCLHHFSLHFASLVVQWWIVTCSRSWLLSSECRVPGPANRILFCDIVPSPTNPVPVILFR